MKKTRLIAISAIFLTLNFFGEVGYAQDPLLMGPGPVTSISNGNGSTKEIAEINNSTDNLPQTPPPPPGWGAPGLLVNPPSADWMNQGTMNVMATGVDSEGVMQQIPLFISYKFNGVNYNITVLNAWNPYTQVWNSNVDEPAYSTTYFLNGFTYNYYTVLPTGTFYFNL